MQRYFTSIKIDNKFSLSSDDMYHIKTVMRMGENDKIEVVYLNELYICHLNNKLDVIIDEKIIQDKINKKKLILCIPLLQEQKMSFVLQKATELGIDEIIPIITERSKVKIEGKEDKKIIRWNKICKEASEQSKRLDIPTICEVKKIKDLSLDGLKIICSTKEKNNTLKKVIQNNLNCDTMVIVVGPEGGFTPLEEDLLISKGFIPTTLGHNIMRVETVPIFLLSILNYELME